MATLQELLDEKARIIEFLRLKQLELAGINPRDLTAKKRTETLISQLNVELAAVNAQIAAKNISVGPTDQTRQQNKKYIATGGANDDTSYDKLEAARLSRNTNTENIAKAVNYTTGQDAPGIRLQNPLGNFASYTYQLSLYMITPDAYEAFIQSGRRDINAFKDISNTGNGAFLIAQSGGIDSLGKTKRAPGFDLDLFIDDLKIKNVISPNKTGSEVNIFEMSFTITEPYGFSFLTKLRNAANTLAAVSKSANYKDQTNPTRQFFVFGIRFLGYDIDGNVITSKSLGQDNIDPAGNDYGIYERFFDIRIQTLKFRIEGKASAYAITATSTPTGVAFGTKQGIVENGASVRASTVREALMGGNGSIGLLEKLNNDQIVLKNTQKKLRVTKYNVDFIGDAKEYIENASLISEADLSKLHWTMSNAQNIDESNIAQAEKSAPNGNKVQITFPTGITIVQAISQIITQSSFLEKALKLVYASAKQNDTAKKSEKVIKPNTEIKVQWFNLGARVKCLGYDPSVADFAYEITYIIQTYRTPIVLSTVTNKAHAYYNPVKRYDYWYTGKNTEIIRYEQQMNNTYFTVALGVGDATGANGTGGDTQTPIAVNKQQDYIKQGSLNKNAQNSYLTSLFDPGAFATAKITILGDPDFLMAAAPNTVNTVYQRFYEQDGYTVSPNGGQVFIEINFNEAQDYKNNTGLLDINNSIKFWNYPTSIQNVIDKRGGGVSYRVQTVESTFRGGKFEQELSCVLNWFSPDAVADGPTTSTGSAPTASGVTTTVTTGLTAEPANVARPAFQMVDTAGGVAIVYRSGRRNKVDTKTVPTKTGQVQDDEAGKASTGGATGSWSDSDGR